MQKILTLVSMLLFAAGAVFAAGLPAEDRSGTLYINPHMISTFYDQGKLKANNHLRVWRGDDKEISFLLTAIADENHECVIEGKAIRQDDGRYEYRENTCRMVFSLTEDQVKLTAAGSDGKSCRCNDLRQGHGCGFHTSIGSGVYSKAGKPRKSGTP